MRRILLPIIVLFLLPATAHAAPTDTQGGVVRVTINAKLTKAHTIRVLPRSQWRTQLIHKGMSHHPATPRWHNSCTHSYPSTFTYGGWYHHYLGWSTWPYVHTHVYRTWSFSGGIYYNYNSNSSSC